MKQVAGFVALMVLSPFAFSEDTTPPLVLDKIVFQTQAKQWVSTKTVLLSVSISVTLSNADLVKARSEIMSSLNQIAEGDWHLIQFDRSQDSSGLEKLFVQAQVRVEQSALTDIYQNAKSVSKPGAQYRINLVDFKPSLEEIQEVRATVRQQLYQQISDEIARMNKAYPMQNYTVSNIAFVDGNAPQAPIAAYAAKAVDYAPMRQYQEPLTVSNELILTAIVEAASNRKRGN